MTTPAARIFVLPREVGSEVITTAVCRGALGVGIASVILTIPVVIDTLIDRGHAEALAVPVLALVGFLVLLVALVRWQTVPMQLLYLVAGSGLAFVYGLAMLDVDPQLSGDGSFVLNRPLVALVLVGGAARRPLQSIGLAGLGFGCATAVGITTSTVAGVAFVPGWGPIMALCVFASAHLALALVRASQKRSVPDLARLEEETRSAALESQFEQRAAAIIHDTVLGDLTAVMNAPGTIDERARDRLRADVATLADASWLRESGPASLPPVDDANLRNAIVSLVSEFQWRGLTVDVADDSERAVRFSPATARVVLAAISACLDNVLQHAQTSSAELILSSSATAGTVMIVDSGVGFDPGDVPDDRLGIRASVTKRIESIGGSVRFWSRPGSGTSILMTVPFDVEPADGS